jgi:hypothetical protein
MASVTTKDDVLRLVQDLPDDSSLDDIIERLILVRKIEVGLAQRGEGVIQTIAEAEFRKQRQDRSWNRG